MRTDLLALTIDDLIVLSNRGLVNRSQKDLSSGAFTASIDTEEDGTVRLTWSDGVLCELPSQRSIAEDCCSCNAMGICRHLIRSILAYQAWVPSTASTADDVVHDVVVHDVVVHDVVDVVTPVTAVSSEESVTPQSDRSAVNPSYPNQTGTNQTDPSQTETIAWDPGEITDAVLEPYFKPGEWERLQKSYAQGQVIELSRSAKPTAYFHQWGISVRFMVPGEVRYVYCSCGAVASEEARLCSHIPLAVWGFRDLKQQYPDQSTGLVSTEIFEPIAPDLIQAIEEGMKQILRAGIAGLTSPIRGAIQRLEKDCRQAGLVWLGEIWADLLQQQEYYHQHNAQFQSSQITELLTEVELRSRALQAPNCPVPQLWIRGSAADRVTDLGATTLVGLGCCAQVSKGQVLLKVYVQEVKSGTVLRVSRSFTSEADLLKPFSQLALTSGFKRFSLASLGRGQVITKGGKRSPSYEFRPGRAAASLNPQTFAWENLRPPLLVDNIQLLQDHLAQLPLAALRPRRLVDNFWVVAIDWVEQVTFSALDQWVVAQLRDVQGTTLVLKYPYYDRGAEGAEVLLALLQQYPDRLRFVSGEVKLSHSDSFPELESGLAPGLEIQPVALIFETPQGQRQMCQPWIETRQFLTAFSNQNTPIIPTTPATPINPTTPTITLPCPDPRNESPRLSPLSTEDRLRNYLDQVRASLTDLLILGLETIDRGLVHQWQDCLDTGKGLGFHQFLIPIQTIVQELQQKADNLHWQPDKITIALRQLFVQLALAELAQSRSPSSHAPA